MPRGKLWETKLRDHTPVWLLEWEVRQRLQRRVLLTVDTTDSCASLTDQLKYFFQAFTNALDIGDSCAMWLIGSGQKILEAEIRHSQQRHALAQKMTNSLTKIRGGTWLGPTLDAMLNEAQDTAPGLCCYYLVVSDGEIFDAEEALRRMPKPFGLVRLGQRQSSQMAVLVQHAITLNASEQVLRQFLQRAPVTAVLEPGGDGSRLVEFSAQGEIIRELKIDSSIPLHDEQEAARVAYVGGTQPQPRLRYQAVDRTWEVTDIECANLIAGQTPHLEQVLRTLEGNKVKWDVARLELLAKDHKKTQKFRCPTDCKRENLARRSLFCTCGALLVSLDGIRKPEVQKLYQGKICFSMSAGVMSDCPEPCNHFTGDHAYVLDEGEKPRLVLDLYK